MPAPHSLATMGNPSSAAAAAASSGVRTSRSGATGTPCSARRALDAASERVLVTAPLLGERLGRRKSPAHLDGRPTPLSAVWATRGRRSTPLLKSEPRVTRAIALRLE